MQFKQNSLGRTMNLPSLNNGQNPGIVDEIGISGVVLYRLALLWLYLICLCI